jgi:hypothetical protein
VSSSRVSWIAVLALASIGSAVACGPFFPWQLLDSRSETLGGPIELGFDFEIQRLVPPPRDGLAAVEARPYSSAEAPKPEDVDLQEAMSGSWIDLLPERTPTLTPGELVSRLHAARGAPDGKTALDEGAGLPASVLEYIAGAIEFRADRLDAAAEHFAAIDRLPLGQRRIRTVAANYMLGRVHQRKDAFEAARLAFRTARLQALAGAPDPMGLAVASFGEEARLDLWEAGLVRPPWPRSPPPIDEGKAAGLIAEAVELYAEQAAHGSTSGRTSLRNVATWLIQDDKALASAVVSPLTRHLLVTYVIARDGREPYSDNPPEASASVIDAILARQIVPSSDETDRLAALAYQTAHYDESEKLLATTDRPLGLWVRAKLALRRGDRAAAVRDWTAALNASLRDAKSDATLDGPAKARLRGEAAIVTLAQGNYRESLHLLLPVATTYWGDVAYIAERVLTVDELKSLVDGLPPASTGEADKREDDDYSMVSGRVAALRDLLARRLIRAGREREALPYFSTSTAGFRSRSAGDAQAYLAALEASQPTWAWRNVSRAEALFNLAMLSRQRGMELMGTEGPPDLAAVGGGFASGVGQAGLSDEAALLGPDEAARFAASAPKPDVRFHYRAIAADRALAAADLLPQRSQAYAATLCWAAKFAKASDDLPRAARIYRRYVATGAYQPWATYFGGTCPPPDFERARHHWLRRVARWSERGFVLMQRSPALVSVIVVASGLILAGAIWGMRRAGGRRLGWRFARTKG